jgi:hypothetical protein
VTGEILEAWRISNRTNLRPIERIDDASLRCTLSQRGGRNVVRQFAHLQYVRVFQLRAGPTASPRARVFDTYDGPTGALSPTPSRIPPIASSNGPGWRAKAPRASGLSRAARYAWWPISSLTRATSAATSGSPWKQCGHPLDSKTRCGITGLGPNLS